MSKEVWRQLAILYAPQVRIASNDPWNPVSAEWFLQSSELYFSTILNCDRKRFWKRDHKPLRLLVEPTANTISEQSVNFDHQDYYSGSENKCTRFYLKLKSKKFYFGMNNEDVTEGRVPVYVHILHKENHTELQYFFFHAFNGHIMDCFPAAGIHEGDWEHITIRVNNKIADILPTIPENEYVPILKENIIGIFFARHGHEGRWYFEENSPLENKNDGFSFFENTAHPIVYSGKGGHASYAAPGRQRRFVPRGLPLFVLDDYTNDVGVWWDCWRNVEILDNQPWLFFSGEWGDKASQYFSNDGPIGPLHKSYYNTGDPEPNKHNSVYHNKPVNPLGPHLIFWRNISLALIGLVILIIFLFTIFVVEISTKNSVK